MNKHGFRELSRKHSNILEAELIQFEHEKSGARLAVILCEDPNKVFQIAFRTPSDNSTGVAHIMEHSVLCGSRKYPVKEPFVELAKGSINTFLNAMTYPDKTVYPIATTNDKDFKNLEDVYLDAVFYPNIYENPYTLMQEGWHYHLENEADPIRYNGVVYNEMKGVFSNPEETLDRKSYGLLFPDTIYGQESGGDPNFIPDLSYEAFLDFHRRYYHPSNSYIYLYGNIDLDEQLEYLNSWLENYDRIDPDSDIAVQKAFDTVQYTVDQYPITEKSDDDEDYISLNWVFEDRPSLRRSMLLQILGYTLLNSNAAPLRKALMNSGLVKDMNYSYSTPLLQPVLSIELKGTNKEKAQELHALIEKTLREIAAGGLNQEDVDGAVNITEFKTLEVLGGETGTTPRGLLLGLEMLESWLYADDAFERLNYEDLFESIRKEIASGKLEEMIVKDLIENTHQGIIALEPNAELAGKQEAALEEKLRAFKESLSEDEIRRLVDETNELMRRQGLADTEEALATIPRLEVSEISREANSPSWEIAEEDGIHLIEHREDTKGLVYLDFYFDAEYVPSEDIPTLSLINKIIGRIGTKNLSYEQLLKETDLYTGGISSSFETHESGDGEVLSNFILHTKSTVQNVKEVLRLAREILSNPAFDDSDQIQSIIAESKMIKQQQIQSSGHATAVQRISAHYSKSARLFEEVGGIRFYDWISDLDSRYKEIEEDIKKDCERTIREVINRNGLLVSITTDSNDFDQVKREVVAFCKEIPQAITEKKAHEFAPLDKNEAFMTAGTVQYNAQGGSFRGIAPYSGAMLVAKTILSMDYLWNRVRVLGGAYGAGFGMSRSGELYLSSYRDPNLAKTYEAYRGVPAYLRELDLPQSEIDKYIIGTISPKEIPLSPSMRASLANTMYLTKLTAEDRQREREEILDVSQEDLQKLGDVVEAVLDQNQICTIGSSQMIQKDQEEVERFDEVRNVG